MSLNTVYASILNAAIADVVSVLTTFAADPLFAEKFALVFGTTLSSEQFLQVVAALPEIEVLADSELKGASGAFSAQTGKIYLAEGLLQGEAARLEAVLIEEIGHFVDAQVNATDTAGDEGELFSAIVRGVSVSGAELSRIKTEDDHAVVIIDGQATAIEMANTEFLVNTTTAKNQTWPSVTVFAFNPGVISFSNPQFSVNENGTPITQVNLTRTGGSDGEVTVTLTPSDGTAIGSHQLATTTIRAYIDGSDFLHIQGNNLFYIHRNFDLPGQWGGAIQPTYINGVAWFPTWSGNISNSYTLQSPLASSGTVNFTIKNLSSRGDVTLTQTPDSGNNWEAIILLNDDSIGGAEWYEVELTYTTPDDLPLIILAVSPTSVTEDGTANLVYTFTRTDVTSNALTVNYGITGTATNGTDYATIGTSVTFAANSAIATVTVNPTADTTIENNETVALTLTTGTGYTIGTTTAVTGTITNDDLPSINLSPNGQTIVEGLTSPQNLSYTVSLSGSSPQTITVQYSTANGTALAGSDYTTTTGTLTFNPGVTSQVINIPILNDSVNEANETLTVKLTSPSNATLGGTATVTTTITDTLSASTTTTLPANVENLTLTGSSVINGTGNTGNNVLTGNSANNTLNGGDGNDTLNGGTGVDTLIGGLGNDVYQVDSTTDVITENASEGTDTIQSSVTFSLAAFPNIENLTLTASSAINGTGNAANNSLTGNAANNTLDGGDGNDSLNGGAGNDTLIGGNGNDFAYYYSSTATVTVNLATGTASDGLGGTDTLSQIENVQGSNTAGDNITGSTGNNILYGYGGNDTLNGGDGNDTLIGGTGNDLLTGGNGNDTAYYYTVTGAVTVNLTTGIANDGEGGTDTLSQIENVQGSNTASDNLTGNTGVNVLYGYGGADILTGGGGNDLLYLGSDTVKDTVNYTSGDGVDTVYNFVRGVGGDLLKFTGITAIDVQLSGSNTLFKVGDGITGNSGFGSGTLLLTTSATTGFTATDIGVNLLNVTNSAGFFFS